MLKIMLKRLTAWDNKKLKFLPFDLFYMVTTEELAAINRMFPFYFYCDNTPEFSRILSCILTKDTRVSHINIPITARSSEVNIPTQSIKVSPMTQYETLIKFPLIVSPTRRINNVHASSITTLVVSLSYAMSRLIIQYRSATSVQISPKLKTPNRIVDTPCFYCESYLKSLLNECHPYTMACARSCKLSWGEPKKPQQPSTGEYTYETSPA